MLGFNTAHIARVLAGGALLLGGLATLRPAHADLITVTYGAAGVQTPDTGALAATVLGTENFDERTNSNSFTTDFGTGGVITGTYSGNFNIYGADQYGGAGGSGKYIVTFNSGGYTLNLTTQGIPGVNYFGFWLSALDAGNQVVFLRNGQQVGTYTPPDLLAAVGSKPAYFGNPNPAFLHQDGGEPFAFVNFYDTSGYFDAVHVYEQPYHGGYESDNHTVGYRAAAVAQVTPGNQVPVPEPATLGVFASAAVTLLLLRRRAG